MAGGINIAFVSDVRSFLKGTESVERSLDDVGSSLDDLTREATTAGDKTGDAMNDAARDTTTAGDKIEKSFRQTFDTVETKAKDAGRVVARSSKDGFREAGQAAKGFEDDAGGATTAFKDEAVQNFAETASSFDGSMSSVADMAQSTFGGLASSAGPIGLVAAAGALAFGGMSASFAANADAITQRAQDMYDDLMASGARYLSASFVQTEVDKIVTGADDAAVSLADATSMAADLGLSVSDVVAAFAGSGDAQAAVLDKLAATRDAMGVLSRESGVSYAGEIMHLNDIERQLHSQQGAIDGVREKTAIARDAVYSWTDAYSDLKAGLDSSVGYYGGREFTTTVRATADISDVDRQMRDLLSRRYEVTAYVNTRPGVSNW